MTDLATENDIEARLGRSLTSTEQTRAAAYLADASALIRKYTKQQFEEVSGDTIVLRPVGTVLRLPQRPVTAVNSVTALASSGGLEVALPVGTWTFDGIDQVDIWPDSFRWMINLPDAWYDGDGPDTYRVDYDHGDDTIPPDVVAICCGMVLRVLLSPSLVEGLTSERIGEYSYQLGQFPGGAAAGVTVRLSEADKQALDDAGYRRRATTIQLRM